MIQIPMQLPKSLEKLINEFAKLPGVGPKSAQRLAFYILKQDNIEINSFINALTDLKAGVTFCDICHTMTEISPCKNCIDQTRNKTLLCIVEDSMDAIAIDKTGKYDGLFHILGGVLNPLEGIGPEKLNINSLLKRLENSEIKEIIIATNPNLEGETTAMHLTKILSPLNIQVTRIARGLPMGGDLEYTDEMTLRRALEGRREI